VTGVHPETIAVNGVHAMWLKNSVLV